MSSRSFPVPWALYVDDDHESWLDSTCPVHQDASKKTRLEVARTKSGYYVGCSGCPERTRGT